MVLLNLYLAPQYPQLQNQLLRQRADLVKQIRDRNIEVNETATTLADVFGEQRVDFELVKIGEQLVKVNQDFQLLGNVVAVQTENALSTNSQSVQKCEIYIVVFLASVTFIESNGINNNF